MQWLTWMCVYVLLLIMRTWLRGSRFRSLQDLYIRSEKWYSTLRRVFSTSGLQSLRALYCGGTDWGKPSCIPEQPAKYIELLTWDAKTNLTSNCWGTDPRTVRFTDNVKDWGDVKLNYARIQQKNFAYLNCVYFHIYIKLLTPNVCIFTTEISDFFFF